MTSGAGDTFGVHDATGRVDEVHKASARLIEMGLLRLDEGERLTAVSPMLAEATVLGAEDLELGARRAAVEQRRDSLRQLIPDVERGAGRGCPRVECRRHHRADARSRTP